MPSSLNYHFYWFAFGKQYVPKNHYCYLQAELTNTRCYIRIYTFLFQLFNKYSKVLGDTPFNWAEWRNVVLARKRPRRMLVQANTFAKGQFLKIVLLSSGY